MHEGAESEDDCLPFGNKQQPEQSPHAHHSQIGTGCVRLLLLHPNNLGQCSRLPQMKPGCVMLVLGREATKEEERRYDSVHRRILYVVAPFPVS